MTQIEIDKVRVEIAEIVNNDNLDWAEKTGRILNWISSYCPMYICGATVKTGNYDTPLREWEEFKTDNLLQNICDAIEHRLKIEEGVLKGDLWGI